MKKILDLIKYLFKDADFVMVFVIFCVVFANVIFACTLETCVSCNSTKTPVEESTNIDSNYFNHQLITSLSISFSKS